MSSSSLSEHSRAAESEACSRDILDRGGNGEMAARFAAFDWAATPLGPVRTWPHGLKAAVRLALGSRYPMFVWWGPELINLYNDAYIPVLGKRHPRAFGHAARPVWEEIWPVVGPLAERVMRTGQATWNEELLLVMERHGYTEETYFTFSYSPAADDDGVVRGIFCACTEETSRVLGQRRLRTLRDLAAQTRGARSAEAAGAVAAGALAANAYDLPFAAVYLLEQDGHTLRRVGLTGLDADSAALPDELKLDGKPGKVAWPLAQAQRENRAVVVELPGEALGPLRGAPWPEAPRQAMVLPVAQRGQAEPAGFAILGISPRRVFDEDYRGFFELLVSQLGTAIADARALEAELRRAQLLAQVERSRFDETLRTAEIGIWTWDIANDRVVTDENLSRLFAVPRAVAGAPLSVFMAAVHPDDREETRRRIEGATAANGVFEVDYRVVQSSGSPRWVTARGRIYFDREGKPSRLSGVLIDITQRKAAEAVLRRSEAQIAALIHHSPTGMLLIDDRLRVQQVNAKALPAFRDIDPLIGRDFEEIMQAIWPEPRAAEIVGRFRTTLASGTPFRAPVFSATRLGGFEPEFFEWEIHRITLPDGQAGVVCYFSDITAHVMAQRAIREGADQLRLALSAAKLGHWIWDRESDLVTFTERGAEIFALPPNAAGVTWTSILHVLHPEDARRAEVAVRESVLTRTDYDVEYRLFLPTGQVRWIAAKGGVRYGADQTVIGMLGVVQDITAHKEAEGERAALLQREQEAREEAEALNEAARLFASQLDLDATVQQTIDAATRLTGADFGAFIFKVRRHEQETYAVHARAGTLGTGAELDYRSFEAVFEGRRVLRGSTRAAAGEGRPAERVAPAWPEASFLAVPVRSRSGEVLAGMLLGQSNGAPFTARAERIAVGIATQAAVAIDNAKLYAEARSFAERLNFSLSSMQLGTWSWDPVTDRIVISPRAAEIYGFSADQPITRSEMREVVHVDEREQTLREALAAVAERRDYDMEYRILHPTRGVRWVSAKGRCALDEKGIVSGMVGVVQDITERKHAELQRQNQKDVLELIVRGGSLIPVLERLATGAETFIQRRTTVLFMLMDPERRHLRPAVTRNCPPSWAAMVDPLPVDPEAGSCGAAASRGERVIEPDLRAVSMGNRLQQAALEHGFKASWSTPIISSSGQVLGTFAVYYAEPGTPTPEEMEMAVVVTRTAAIALERKQSEQALRESQAKLEEHAHTLEQRVVERTARLRETIGELEAFSYSVSHDMRAPLRAMQGYADALLTEHSARLDAEAVHYLKRIHRNAQRLDLLVRDILTYSKVAKEEIALVPVDLESLVQTLLTQLPHLQRPLAEVILLTPLPAVLGHEAYLSQIFTNLLGNAVKFVEPGTLPRVEIRAERRDEWVRISIRDNGIGIAPAHFNRIFQIFGRIYADARFEGTGIGLSIVRKAVQRIGGTIGLESAPGKGSCFWFEARLADPGTIALSARSA